MRKRDLPTLLRELKAEQAAEVTVGAVAPAVSADPTVALANCRERGTWRASRSGTVELAITAGEAKMLKDAGAWEVCSSFPGTCQVK